MADLETYTNNLQAALKSLWGTQPDPVYVCFQGRETPAGGVIDTTICAVALGLDLAEAWVADVETGKRRWWEMQPVLVAPK
jgi:hypothetical protein